MTGPGIFEMSSGPVYLFAVYATGVEKVAR